jgi:hypothetical protein
MTNHAHNGCEAISNVACTYKESMLYGICLVSFVRDFGSINLLFFNHMPDITVPKNNRVTLSKSCTKDTQDRHQITRNGRHS